MIYNGYKIKMILVDGLFFPQIWLNGKWIHEFMTCWCDESKAIQASKDFIDQCDGTPTTDAQLFQAAKEMFKGKQDAN